MTRNAYDLGSGDPLEAGSLSDRHQRDHEVIALRARVSELEESNAALASGDTSALVKSVVLWQQRTFAARAALADRDQALDGLVRLWRAKPESMASAACTEELAALLKALREREKR